jgi:hypothetical protein
MIFHIFCTPTEYSKAMCGAELKPLELGFTTLELALKADEEADPILKPCRFCLNSAQN